MSKQRNINDEPMLANYPVLQEWLLGARLNAQCAWQHGTERGSKMRVEGWLTRGGLVIVMLYSDRRGFSVFTEGQSIDIPATFADAEKRLGLA